MAANKPRECVTPKKDRERYKLTSRDLRTLAKLIEKANAMLTYYINMPENKTGELITMHAESLEHLKASVDDFRTTLDDINIY